MRQRCCVMKCFSTFLIKFSGILCLFLIIKKFFQLTLRWVVKWNESVNPLGWSAGKQRCEQHPGHGPFDSRVLRSCLVQQCKHLPHWHCRQRRLLNCDWMPASYNSRQPSHSRRHIIGWAWSERSHTFSSTSYHRTGYLLHSVLTCHRVGIQGISNRDTLLHPPHNNSSVHLTAIELRRSGQITDVMRSGWTTLWDSVFSFSTSAPTLLEWPFHEHRGSDLTASLGGWQSCRHGGAWWA